MIPLPVLALLALFAAAALWPTTAPVPAHQPRPPGWYLAQARTRRAAAAGHTIRTGVTTRPGVPLGRSTHPQAAATYADAVRAPQPARRPHRDMATGRWPAPPRPHLPPRMPVTAEIDLSALAGVPPQP
jgi:hypothetical protein